MKFRLKECSLFLVCIAIFGSKPINAASKPEHLEADQAQTDLGGSARSRFQVPSFPGFETYKQIFHKDYSSGNEELVRQQNYLSKMFRAMISVMKYKTGNSTFYLELNSMSDFTKEELVQLKNRYSNGSILFQDSVPFGKSSNSLMSEFELLEDESELEMLERVAKKYPDSFEVADLRDEFKWAIERKKHSVTRNNLMDSNNQQNVLVYPDRPNLGLVVPAVVGKLPDQMAQVNWEEYWTREQLEDYYIKNRLDEALAEYRKRVEQTKPQDNGEDKIFVDHRNCFLPPRNQLNCGACYAFAWTSILEWMHCKTTGQLVAFSEQYLIDCGHYKRLSGCNGGQAVRAGEFVHNFGVELRSLYPFIGVDGECPHDMETDLKTTGYIRMNSLKSAFVPIGRWEEALPSWPMYMTMSTEGPFYEYGGGVFDTEECRPYPGHAVVVVGHGREDGLEYWLIRNSHSVAWGEGGFMKLSKRSKCIFPSFGYALGIGEDGRIDPQFEFNKQHDSEKILNYFRKIWPYAKY